MCVYWLDTETKQQSSQWKNPPSPYPKGTRSLLKCEEHAYCFFWQLQSCALQIYSTRTNPKPILLHQHLMTPVERRVTKTTWNVEHRRLVLKGRRLTDITMILAKLQDAIAKLLSVHITKCFKSWRNQWACCGHFQGENTNLKVSLRRNKFNPKPVWSHHIPYTNHTLTVDDSNRPSTFPTPSMGEGWCEGLVYDIIRNPTGSDWWLQTYKSMTL